MSRYYLLLAIFIGIPLFYLCSALLIGWVLIHVFGVKSAPDWFSFVYAPIMWMIKHNETFEKCFNWVANSVGIK